MENPNPTWWFGGPTPIFGNTHLDFRYAVIKSIAWGPVPLPRIPVTTRIITFLVGDSYKPAFATVTGRGDNPKHSFVSTQLYI